MQQKFYQSFLRLSPKLDKFDVQYINKNSKIAGSEFQVHHLIGSPTKETVRLEKEGCRVVGKVTDCETFLVNPATPSIEVSVIDYVYEDQNGNEIYGSKKFDHHLYDFCPRIPKKDDLIEVIFDEKDCPKVEVISVDSKPRQIVIHLPDGRLLKINCEY